MSARKATNDNFTTPTRFVNRFKCAANYSYVRACNYALYVVTNLRHHEKIKLKHNVYHNNHIKYVKIAIAKRTLKYVRLESVNLTCHEKPLHYVYTTVKKYTTLH